MGPAAGFEKRNLRIMGPAAFFEREIYGLWITTQVHCVDLDKSFPTSIYLQNMASIQPRTSPCEIDLRPGESQLLGVAKRPSR